MSYVPKYILKRMFPKEKCLKLVKHEGKDVIVLAMVNVISPIAVPDGPINLGPVKLPDEVEKYLKIAINGVQIPVTPQIFANDVSLWYEGKKHTANSILKESSAAGLNIPVGGILALMINKAIVPAALNSALVNGAEIEVQVDVALNNPVSVAHKAILNVGGNFDPANPL